MTNSEFATALRALADLYEDAPDMARPEHLDFYLSTVKREDFARAVRAFGACKKLPPAYAGDMFFTTEHNVAGFPVRLHTYRSNVCRKVRVMKEVEDWDCTDPLLEAAVAEA